MCVCEYAHKPLLYRTADAPALNVGLHGLLFPLSVNDSIIARAQLFRGTCVPQQGQK